MIQNDQKRCGIQIRNRNKSFRINKTDSEAARLFSRSLYDLGLHATHVSATSDVSYKLFMDTNIWNPFPFNY
jgi:hypothetical protein